MSMESQLITMVEEQLPKSLILCSRSLRKYFLLLFKIANKRIGGGSGGDHSSGHSG